MHDSIFGQLNSWPSQISLLTQAVAGNFSTISEEQLKAFLEKVQSDTSLQEKLQAATDSDAVLAIATDAGFEISAENLKHVFGPPEISDGELEGAAGGYDLTDSRLTCPQV